MGEEYIKKVSRSALIIAFARGLMVPWEKIRDGK